MRELHELAICSGIGGISLGLKRVIPRLRTVCHIEREAYAAAVLVARMETRDMDPAPIWSDLSTFEGTAWRGRVDIISAGIPCQPFSVAGKQKGLQDDRWIWPGVEKIIRDVGPRFVFLENVPGFLRHGLAPVLNSLAELGFNAEWGVFSAAASGAPHIRKRFFLLASYTSCTRLAGWELPVGEEKEESTTCGIRWWETEPSVGRVDDGTPNRVDRLRAIGNAVVPAVAERAFRTLYSRVV